MDIGQVIINQALQFVGLYETKNNAAWGSIVNPSKGKVLNTELHDTLVQCGWQDGQPYCISFAKACWLLAYDSFDAHEQVAKVNKINPSAMNTFKLFKQSITKVPTPGSIIFFQLGKTDHGHAGIVVNSDKGLIATIEGNTSNSDKASVSADRNGDGIYKKVRHLDFTVTNSLHLIGFLSPFSL